MAPKGGFTKSSINACSSTTPTAAAFLGGGLCAA
eukprot:CAMPEP_0170600454 /NCGR_PEP_ID=MMETSP0224-20130122/17342_1 /TAXON_ID=285029 /ORGANISM="Togula jolla, Strain CCCM 725" /LENGTH=33 /DNA_ID= /DNA_START= /DNA_END= /DNA_ORIENTATION=